MPRLRVEVPTMLRVADVDDNDEAEREDEAVDEATTELTERRIARTL
jgi:hypothetical protein